MTRKALLVLDLINEITHPAGAYPEVCLAHLTERDVLGQAATAIQRARAAHIPVIHVVLGFSADYAELPESSPLFTEARARSALVIGTWGTRIHESVAPLAGEPIVVKSRVDPFTGTPLDLLLRARGIGTLLLVGTTTDLVVLSTARQAHDRGYVVEVLADATATHDAELQDAAQLLLARTATVSTVAESLPSPIDEGLPTP